MPYSGAAALFSLLFPFGEPPKLEYLRDDHETVFKQTPSYAELFQVKAAP